jgi:nitrogen regulatory protein PII
MELNFLIAVTDKAKSKDYIDLYNKLGVPETILINGRGTATREILSIMGIEVSERVVVIAAADREKTIKIFKAAKSKLYIDIPGNGILVSIPIKSIGGVKTLNYLTGNQSVDKTKPKLTFKEELIIVIMNHGFSEKIMEVARTAGAGGGTILSAKGTGAKFTEKFFGIKVAEDKEALLIVSRSQNRTDIINALMKTSDENPKIGAVAFSLPVTQVAGINFGENDN